MTEHAGEFTVAELHDRGWLLVEDGNHGEYRPRSGEFGSGDWAFIRAADLDDAGNVLFEQAQRINDVARARIRKGVGARGDVLLSHKGTVGKVAFVQEDAPPFICSPQTTFWRSLNPEKVDRRFLYFFLRSSAFQQQLDAREGETDMAPYVSLTAQRQLRILLPKIRAQRAIAGVLGALDDKVALNHRMNRTLEAMAAALFQKWCDDNELCTASVRAEELIQRGVLLINDGYRAKNSEMADPGLPFARAGNLQTHFDFSGADLLGEAGVRAAREKVSQSFDCVFTSKGTVGRIAQVLPSTPRFVYSPQLCFWRSLRPDKLNPFVLNRWMNDREFREQIDAVKGQTDMADYVSLRDQRRMTVTLPFQADQTAVGSRLRALAGLQDGNMAQSRTLAALRDALLPPLLSGSIRLRDAEHVLAASV